MIKIALQHWLFEKCINILFDNISLNFSANGNFLEGDVFEYLKLVYSLQMEDKTNSMAITELFNAKIFNIDMPSGSCDVTYEKMLTWQPVDPYEEIPNDAKISFFDGQKYYGIESHNSDFFFSLADIRKFRKR